MNGCGTEHRGWCSGDDCTIGLKAKLKQSQDQLAQAKDRADRAERAGADLRAAIGSSKNYGVGWLLSGDDGVLQACLNFDKTMEKK